MKNQFVAFISYSRKDKKIADWFHSHLENYRIPDNLHKTTALNTEGKYIRKVFIDRQDLHVEVRPFTDGIKEALRNSQFLIIICSTNSAKSEFVEMEIKYFLETHDQNSSLIIPIFVNDVSNSIPPAILNTSIMSRHFPIYNSQLSENSEANRYCLYQVISYMLGANFADIYNRYEAKAMHDEKTKRRKYIVLSSICIVIAAIIGIYHYSYTIKKEQVIERQRELLQFERQVFPAAVVHGYEDNFLTPVVKYLQQQDQDFKIYVLMPKNEREITDKDRLTSLEYEMKRKCGIDSIVNTFLPTATQRGSRILQVYQNGKPLDGIFIDFATTTTSFLDIANFKKEHKAYRKEPIDSIIQGFASDFILQTNTQLKDDSTYISFFLDKDQFIDAINAKIEAHNFN